MEENELKKKSALGIAALVLGIISILSALFWYISLPSGVLAIILGTKSIKKIGSKIGKAGLITGIIGLALLVFLYVSLILIMIIASL